MTEKIEFELVDISAQVFGKYQHCTRASDGMWYADEDFTGGFGFGAPKRGALPAPQQDTPELTTRAHALHEESARRATRDALRKASPPTQAESRTVILASAIGACVVGLLYATAAGVF